MLKSILTPVAVVCSLTATGCGPMYGSGTAQPPPAQGAGGGGPPGGGPPGGDPWEGAAPERAEPPAPGPATAARPEAAGSPAPAAPAAPSGEGRRPTTQQQLLDAHNRYRARHCAPPLTWAPELAAFAQRWADTLRDKGCAFEHSRGKYGENLAAGTAGALDASSVVAMWYDELKGYSFQQPGFSMQTGHFTQVVWRGTGRLGCAMTTCKGMELWVCEYDPPGNWEGKFREHVLPASCAQRR